MIKGRLFLILIVALAATGASAESVTRSDFQHTAAIRGDYTSGDPARVALTRDIVATTKRLLPDLRLFDDEGLEIPYVLYEQYQPGQIKRTYSFKVVNYREDDGGAQIILERMDPSKPVSLNGIEIHTSARDYKKTVTVFASPNGNSWSEVGTDTIFDFTSRIDLRKTRIELPEATLYPYIRILLKEDTSVQPSGPDISLRYEGLDFKVHGDAQRPFRIDGVSGWGGQRVEGGYMVDRTSLDVVSTNIDIDGNTIVDLGMVNLPLTELSIDVRTPYFYRKVEIWTSGGIEEGEFQKVESGTIYRIPGMNRSENLIRLAGSRLEDVQLKVINKDSPPLEFSEVTAGWHRLNLYFIPEKEMSYALYFGGNQIHRPEYDVTMLIPSNHDKLAGYQEARLEQKRKNPDYRPVIPKGEGKVKMEKNLFTFVVVLMVFILGFWLFKLMRKIPSDRQG
jgi:hypothetical protein